MFRPSKYSVVSGQVGREPELSIILHQLAAAAAAAKWEQAHPTPITDQFSHGIQPAAGKYHLGVESVGEGSVAAGDFLDMDKEAGSASGDGSMVGGESETMGAEHGEEGVEEGLSLMKALKIAVPHVILLSVLLSYLAAGAVILQKLENGTETAKRYEKLVELDRLFNWVVNETWLLKSTMEQHEHGYDEWHAQVYERLQNISVFYFNRKLTKTQTPLETVWTFQTAVLYTLTVLTACGYSHIDPITNEGMIFAVAYALLGIPLMFITAADIGKFLSETFTKAIQFGNDLQSKLVEKFRRFERKKRRQTFVKKMSSRQAETLDGLMVENGRTKNHSNNMNSTNNLDEDEKTDDDAEDGNNNQPAKWLMEEHMGENLWFPISAYFILMCMYCSVGAFLFRRYQENWNFVRAFHFAFNTVVTVGLGDVVVSDALYLCCIVAYVIIGLSVVTMCVDLASSHLQTYFQRIHYFGRARAHFLGMSEDIREMVGLLAALRNKKGGGKVTWQDLKALMEAEQVLLYGKAFVPRHLSRWRYVDDTTSSALSSGRYTDSYTPSSSVSVLSGTSTQSATFPSKRASAASRFHQLPQIGGLPKRSPLPKVSCVAPPPIPTSPRSTSRSRSRRSKKRRRSTSRRKYAAAGQQPHPGQPHQHHRQATLDDRR